MVLVQGVTITALVRQSMTTKRESYPLESGRSVMKSMVIIPHTIVGIWFSCSGTWVHGRTLVAWQVAHPSTKS